MCTIYFYLYLLLTLKYMYCQLYTSDPEVHLTSDTLRPLVEYFCYILSQNQYFYTSMML